MEPHIAHTWELSADGLTWTFYLRKDIHFHNETVLTSKDVQFSFERLKASSLSFRMVNRRDYSN